MKIFVLLILLGINCGCAVARETHSSITGNNIIVPPYGKLDKVDIQYGAMTTWSLFQ